MRINRAGGGTRPRDFFAEYGLEMDDPDCAERIESFLESFSAEVDAMISSMLSELREVTHSESAVIYAVDGRSLILSYVRSDPPIDAMHCGGVMALGAESICSYVAKTRKPLVTGDVLNAPANMPFSFNSEFDSATGRVTVSAVTLPVLDGVGNLAGLLQLMNHRDEVEGMSPYEDWMFGYALILTENFSSIIADALDSYLDLLHPRRCAPSSRSCEDISVGELYRSIRGQVSMSERRKNLPWLSGLGTVWSRRDVRKEFSVEKRISAYAQYVNQFDDVITIIEMMMTEARDVTCAAGGVFYLLDENDLLRLAYAQNDGAFSHGSRQSRYFSGDEAVIDDASVVAWAALARRTICVPDVSDMPDGMIHERGGILDDVSGGRAASILTVPVLDFRSGLVAVFQLTKSGDAASRGEAFDDADAGYAELLAKKTMPYLTRAIMTRRLIDAMLRMSYMRDPVETGSHVRRVGEFSAEIYRRWAENREVSEDEIKVEEDALRVAAMLHDIGKVAVPDAVLMKPAKLTDEEYAIIKTHCAKGASMYALAHSKLEHIAYDITLHHHQRWDGKGYTGDPDVPVLAGEDIPLCARVTAVADVLDALLFQRVYKASWEFDDAMAELMRNSGTQFDPEIVDAACQISDTLRAIASQYQQ
ncbi:MAG: HD domain-containing protein [Synergistaceae bacterium]|jgi:HD-GYP domain-containing protein (c-di-GMP phosphodiesterase class II)|nr:HD domain-containing protein [Synergistaceae bacterium]